MSKSPAFQFYAAEYLADEDVQLMTLEEEGCYIRLLAYCWREGSIPSDLDKLSRLCKGASTTVISMVVKCFDQDVLNIGRMIHKRLEVERDKQREWKEKSSRGGRKSAEVRANRESNLFEPPLEPNGNTASSSASSSSIEATTTPSLVKKITKSAVVKSRHDDFKGKIKQYWSYKNPGVEMPWGPAEGKQLAMWLAESPLTTVEKFAEFLRNRARSEGVTHSDRPSRWIGDVTRYAQGPLNAFKQPIATGGKVNGRSADRALSTATDLIQEIEDSNGAHAGELLSGSGAY